MSDNITLPAASFAVLAAGLTDTAADASAVLRDAGMAAGRTMAAALPGLTSEPRSSRRFWNEAMESIRTCGLGSIGVEDEAGTWLVLTGTELSEPAPHRFTAGVLEGLLTAAAGEPVAVVPAPGPEVCHFVAGAPRLMVGIARRLENGATLEDALRGDQAPA